MILINLAVVTLMAVYSQTWPVTEQCSLATGLQLLVGMTLIVNSICDVFPS